MTPNPQAGIPILAGYLLPLINTFLHDNPCRDETLNVIIRDLFRETENNNKAVALA
jgi:hypothetical protein